MPKTINLTQKTQPSLWSLLFAVLALALALSGLAGCSSSQKSSDASASPSASATEKKASEAEPVEVRVALDRAPEEAVVRPLSEGIVPEIRGRELCFTVSLVKDNWGKTPSGWVCLDYCERM